MKQSLATVVSSDKSPITLVSNIRIQITDLFLINSYYDDSITNLVYSPEEANNINNTTS